MRSLLHYPIDITHENDDFVITQVIGDTADDVITIRISRDQALQVARFLYSKQKSDESDSPELSQGFAEFWNEYPRKDGKARAFDLWKRQRLHTQYATVIRHLRAIKGTEQWTNDGGKYVPHASTYLSQKRYLDEVEAEDTSRWQ